MVNRGRGSSRNLKSAVRDPHSAILNGALAIVACVFLVGPARTLATSNDGPAEASGTWTVTDPMSTGRASHTATLLLDGRVLVAGGYSSRAMSTAELYDPLNGTWTSTEDMSVARAYHTATLQPDGTVLVAGGTDDSTLAEIYDPTSGTWSVTAAMASPRIRHAAVLLSDGRVLVAGGDNNNEGDLSSAEVYDPTTGVWTPTGGMSQGRTFFAAVQLCDGRVLAAGGVGGEIAGHLSKSSTEIYDPGLAGGSWSAARRMTIGRDRHTATLLNDCRVLVVGGPFPPQAQTAELFDPVVGSWGKAGTFTCCRFDHTATLLDNGRVLVAGGTSNLSALFDPTRRSWSDSGTMIAVRTSHTATLLNDGRVLVVGGYVGGTPSSSAEIFEP
jgi:hypothetical protein